MFGEWSYHMGNKSIPLKWVKLKHYCALSGDSVDAVHARRRRGQWLNDVQCRIAPDGNLWVNLSEVEQWVENTRTVADAAPLG